MRTLTVSFCLLCACRGQPSMAVDAGDAPVAPVAVAVSGDAGWVLTDAKLSAYLRYQRAALVVADAGAVAERARVEAAARAASGVTAEDVMRIEEMVSAIVARRTIARLTTSDLPLVDLQKMSASLSPEQRARADAAMEGLRLKSEQGKSLQLEREKFGDAAVTLMLTREVEWTRGWEALTAGQ